MTRHAFLIYANRSGSTLLAAQLSQGIAPDRLVVVPEFRIIEFLFHIGDAKARRLGVKELREMIADDRQVVANLAISRDELLTLLRSTDGEGIESKLDVILRAYLARHIGNAMPEVVMWKWGNAATYVPQIHRVFPDAAFLQVIRDARGVVNSLLTSQSPYFPGEDLARGSTLYAVHHWKSSLRRNERPLQAGLDALEVRYRDLVERPDEVIGAVTRFLGLGGVARHQRDDGAFRVSATERGLHRLVGQSPRPGRIEGWRGELEEWRCYVVQRAAREELKTLGYELAPTSASPLRKILWLARAQGERLVGLGRWALRRIHRYGPRPTLRLVRLRIRAWMATRRVEETG